MFRGKTSLARIFHTVGYCTFGLMGIKMVREIDSQTATRVDPSERLHGSWKKLNHNMK
jgi:hypothetical protein